MPADPKTVGTGGGRRPKTTLVERERELAALEEALGGAGDVHPRLLVVEGAAGIGKTRLLEEAIARAREAGARVLFARGSELESEFAFGIVRQLFEEVVRAADPDPFDGAAAAAREVLGAPASEAGGDEPQDVSFAILHALYWLVVNVATAPRLVLVVDDLHLADEPSLRFLNYLLRRAERIAISVISSVRPLEGAKRRALLDGIVGDPLAVIVRPAPLSAEATAHLLGEALGADPADPFSRACHETTQGNPLLLDELTKALKAEGVVPDLAHIETVRDLGPKAVSRAVLVRIRGLTPDALALARAASVFGDRADLALAAGAANLDPATAAKAATALVGEGILDSEAEAAFTHPVVGAAIYRDIPVNERAFAHERAAEALRMRGAPAGSIAVHLLRAPPRGAEWVCDVLERATRASLRAGAPASAVRYLERALAEPPPPSRRAGFLLALGRAAAIVDAPAAIEHLGRVLETTDDHETRNSVALTLARTLLYTGRAEESEAVMRGATARLGADAVDLRREFEAIELMAPLFGLGEPTSLERLAPYRGPVLDEGVGAKMLAAVTARHLAYAGGSADECARLALGALGGGELIEADNVLLSVTAALILSLADRKESAAAWDALMQNARLRGSLPSKAAHSLWGGHALYLRGELIDAEVSLRSALEELDLWSTGPEGRVHQAAFLSAVLRERGDLAGARSALEAIGDPGDATDGTRYWLDARTSLLLAEERFEEALASGEEFHRRYSFIAHPIDTPFRSHRAIALHHLGRREEAVALAGELVDRADGWGAPSAVARASRILGSLDGEGGLDRLEYAVETVEGLPPRLELARSLVAFGAGLRASRRPTDARKPLRRAVELADALGAAPLARRARQELHAAGGRPRTKALTGPESLTPSERRVADRAAAGQTNRAIAEALFVTTKTVELHLRNAYRKLGINSRRELAGTLGDPPE